jgi:hypothetical protein
MLLSIAVSLMFFLPTFGAESEQYYKCQNKCKDECRQQAKDERETVSERGGRFWDKVSAGGKVMSECTKNCDRKCSGR